MSVLFSIRTLDLPLLRFVDDYFFDLDGPIPDVSERYKIFYRNLLEGMGVTPLAPSVYWQRKRQRCPEHAILEELDASELESSAHVASEV